MKTERLARSDYRELMEFLNRAFGFEPGKDFLSFLPKLYREEYDPCRYQLAVRENGCIRGAAGMYPVTLQAAGERLRCCAIGNVAVEQACRGQGTMSLLMSEAVKAALAEGYDLAVLGGQRQRYALFGFEPGGFEYVFTVTRTNVRHCFGKEYASELSLREICREDTELLKEADRLYRQQPCYAEREIGKLYDILCSWSYRPFAVLLGDRFEGYCLRKDSEIREIVLRDPHDLGSLCGACTAEWGDVRLCIPSYERQMLFEAERIAENYRVERWEKYLIYRFETVLSAMLKLKSVQDIPDDGELTVLIHGIGGEERLRLSVKNGKPNVSRCETGEIDLTLSYREAMELFFSEFSEYRRSLPAAVRWWFPLPLSMRMADHT